MSSFDFLYIRGVQIGDEGDEDNDEEENIEDEGTEGQSDDESSDNEEEFKWYFTD